MANDLGIEDFVRISGVAGLAHTVKLEVDVSGVKGRLGDRMPEGLPECVG